MIFDEGSIQVTANDALVVGIIVTAIFSALSFYFSYIASTEGTRAQRAFKVAEFRQKWKNDLRDEIAVLYAESTAGSDELAFGNARVRSSYMKIMLLMNKYDPDYKKLQEICGNYMQSAGNESPDGSDISFDEELEIVSQRILKREWERLKSDLRALKV